MRFHGNGVRRATLIFYKDRVREIGETGATKLVNLHWRTVRYKEKARLESQGIYQVTRRKM